MFAVKLVTGFLPYLTCIVFIVGIACRVSRWNRAAATKMALFPSFSGRVNKWNRIVGEVLVFKGTLDGDKPLWVGTWVFHAALVLILVGHVRVATDFPLLWKAAGLDRAGVESVGAAVGACAGLTLLGMGLYLLLRRFAVLRVREISGAGDYLSIALILAVAATGDVMRFSPHFELNVVRTYIAGLFSPGTAVAPSDPWFLLHFFFAQVLIMYVPFSKLLHIPGVFYSKSLLCEE